MSNYEDWDPEWRPVGDPVPTDDDWNEYDWNDYDASEYDWSADDSTEAYAPSEPSRPGLAFADLEAEHGDATDGEFSVPPDQGEESELRDNPELAVFRRWRAQLGLPVEPDVGGAAPAYAYPDVEEGYGAGAYAAPRPYQYSVPLPSADWEGPKLPQLITPTAEPWKPVEGQPVAGEGPLPAWLRGFAPTSQELARMKEERHGIKWAETGQRVLEVSIPAPSGVGSYAMRAVGHALEPLLAANEAATERIPGLGGVEELGLAGLGALGEAFRQAEPISHGLGMLRRESEAQEQALAALTPEQREWIQRGAGGAMAVITQPQYREARRAYNEKLAELSPGRNEPFLEYWSKSLKTYEKEMPAPVQMAIAFKSPLNALMALPAKMGTAVINGGRVAGLEKAIAGLDKADDSYQAVKAAIKTAITEGLGSKGASQILRGAEDLLFQGRTGKDGLLKVLNENKAADVEAFTRDNLAGRTDEARAIWAQYVQKAKGIHAFNIPLRDRWEMLKHPRRDDLGRIALIHPNTGLESRLAYEIEKKPKGWFDAIVNSDGLAAVNEAFGHAAGDDLLTATGKFIKAKVEQAGGRAFHYGGDEIRLWFPDEETAKRTLTAIDKGLKENKIPMRLRDGTVAGKKGFTISHGYGPDETAAKDALDAFKRGFQGTPRRLGPGVLLRGVVDAGRRSGQGGPGGGANVGGRHDLEARQVETTGAGRVAGPQTPLSPADEWLSSRPPLSLSQQMAQLYRGTVAGDDHRGETRASPPRRRGGRGHATTRLAA